MDAVARDEAMLEPETRNSFQVFPKGWQDSSTGITVVLVGSEVRSRATCFLRDQGHSHSLLLSELLKVLSYIIYEIEKRNYLRV